MNHHASMGPRGVASVVGIVLFFLAAPVFAVNFADLNAQRFPSGGWQDITWSQSGSWTTVDVTAHGVAPGSGDVRAALDALIASINTPTVLYFPSGTYTLDSGDDLVIDKDNIIIRGDGAGQTILELGANQGMIGFEGRGTGSDKTVTSDVAAGGTEIFLDNTTDLSVGDIVRVEEDAPQWERSWGQRSNGVVAAITGVDASAGSIQINVPIDTGLTLSQSPKVREYEVVENVGIEKLTLHRTHDNGADTLDLREVHNAFVRQVESIDTARRHVRITRAHQVVVARNYLHGARDVGGGGNGYGVAVYDLTTHALVIDNIIESTRHALMSQTGASYNVFAYNFNVDPSREDCFADPPPAYCDNSGSWFDSQGLPRQTDVSVHGHWVRHTLYEGNVVYFIESTDYWGEGGPEITFFRNKVRGQPDPYGYLHEGEGIYLGLDTDRQNVIANVLINDSELVLDHSDGQLDDMYIEGNVIKGNTEWDTLSSTSSVPDSLFLDTPPDFWPQNLTWPPFGPDVSGAATNQIPAESRYWDGEPMRPPPAPGPDAGAPDTGVDAGGADGGRTDAGQVDGGSTDSGGTDGGGVGDGGVDGDGEAGTDAASGTVDAADSSDHVGDADAAGRGDTASDGGELDNSAVQMQGTCACTSSKRSAPATAVVVIVGLLALIAIRPRSRRK